jgi:hypothetical protein
VIIPAAIPSFSDANQPMLIVKVIGRTRSGVSLEQAHADLENRLPAIPGQHAFEIRQLL